VVESKPAGSAANALRDLSRARLLDAIRAGASDRAALCATTGLARSTVTRLVRDLVDEHDVIEDDPPAHDARSPGRPVKRLRPAPRSDLVVAVDLGHSHCEVAVVDAEGTVLAADREALDVDASPERALRHAEHAVAMVLSRVGPQAARVSGGAVGLPAPVDVATGSIGNGNVLPRWVDHRPARELAQRLDLPFAVDNDANLGALAEAAFGVARGVADLVYVKVATGIGAGLLLGGRLHHGVRGRAGEIGHVPVDSGGDLCRCGNRGCLETMASMTQVLSAVQPRHDGPITMADVVALVEAGDPGARRVVGDAGRMIGRVLADVVNNLSPQLVVVGGELAAAGDALLSGVRESVDRFAQPGLARELAIELSALGERSSLLGAAALALHPALP
jgi:predicted NBD/HSP70 family sugar kinase